MAHADFVHLRVHSAYSLLEGAIKLPELAELCVRHDMPAVAVTVCHSPLETIPPLPIACQRSAYVSARRKGAVVNAPAEHADSKVEAPMRKPN